MVFSFWSSRLIFGSKRYYYGVISIILHFLFIFTKTKKFYHYGTY